jgi:hypothetical protein
MGVVPEPVEQSDGQLLVSEHLHPLPEGEVRGYEGGAVGSSAPERASRGSRVAGFSVGDMKDGVDIRDVVALTENLPGRGLPRGQVGTVVETLKPGIFEVEFSDDEGRAYASAALKAEQLLFLHYEPNSTGS